MTRSEILLQPDVDEKRSPGTASSNLMIANEQANWGSGRRKVRAAADYLRRLGFPFCWCTAEYPGHAKELAAAAAARETDTIIVAGGDGTLNEVVSGLLNSGRDRLPRIGIVPAGSSNDFSKSLGIPQRVQDACATILRGRTRDVDLGRAGTHCFCSASCLGYFAEVAVRSLRMTRFRGSLRYVIPAFHVIREMNVGWEMTVKTDVAMFQGQYAVLLVGNAPRFGGLTMLPGARPDDGVLDCLLIEMVSRRQALQLIPLVYRKALERHRKVTRFRTTALSVTLNRPSPMCNDGEICSSPVHTVDYRVLPQRLRIIC
ncbi:MAG: diacylglycerol kinase family lipid kinase [Sedimentisphaerales bacterium]|nr:diacylglycerol kinase family lipid kinase [Sedimentisphaerales bacterium]